MSLQGGTMRALLPLFLVQFCCWSGMFLMWIGAYPLITLALLAGRGPRDGMVVLALCFAWYATLAAALAFLIPALLKRVEPSVMLAVATVVGSAGLAGLGLIEKPILLLPCFTALAVGWSALSNLPYTIAGRLVPEGEIEHWFRVFAFSSILPQLAVAGLVIFLIGELNAQTARNIMLAAGVAMALGSGLALVFRRALAGTTSPAQRP